MHAPTREIAITSVRRDGVLEEVPLRQLLEAFTEAADDDEVAEYDVHAALELVTAHQEARAERVSTAVRYKSVF
jgi:hypothetical protein